MAEPRHAAVTLDLREPRTELERHAKRLCCQLLGSWAGCSEDAIQVGSVGGGQRL